MKECKFTPNLNCVFPEYNGSYFFVKFVVFLNVLVLVLTLFFLKIWETVISSLKVVKVAK